MRLGGLARKDERGFTLLEVLLVIIILGVLVSIAVASYLYSQNKAWEMADRANLRTLRSALEAYRTHSPAGTYPSALDDLYPDYIHSRAAFYVPLTNTPYEYDDATGKVRNPAHPER